MNTVQQGVIEFRKAMRLPIGDKPQVLAREEETLHIALIQEEFDETKEALEAGNIVKVADGIGDMIYILYGLASHMGIDMEKIHQLIQEANMTKLDENGNPIYNEAGKIIKPPTFESPDMRIKNELEAQWDKWYQENKHV